MVCELNFESFNPQGNNVNEARLPWMQIDPNACQAMAALNATTSKSSLGMPLIELVLLISIQS